jgi:hypothetical protein
MPCQLNHHIHCIVARHHLFISYSNYTHVFVLVIKMLNYFCKKWLQYFNVYDIFVVLFIVSLLVVLMYMF